MNPDNLKQAWQTQTSQTRLTIDANLLLNEVRRNHRNVTATIFWRDVREIGVCLLMVPLWIYLGIKHKHSSPWTWYLTVPALLWVAGFMLVDRLRHKRQPPEPDEPLRQHVEVSLSQIEHQIWLLRNVHWWYLLPFALSMLAFVGHLAWKEWSPNWWTALGMSIVIAILVIALVGVYLLNQYAVRRNLGPRRQELTALLSSLRDETTSEDEQP